MSRSTMAAALLVLIGAAPVAPQGHGDHTPAEHGQEASSEGMPDGWLVRFDRSGAGPEMTDFEAMEPGWHVRTGRAGAGIFWMPAMSAAGDYTVHATYHLFSPATHPEGFGLLFGGEDLDREGQEYLYFLVRQTGEYLVKRRSGSETEILVEWTANDAIPAASVGQLGSTRYDLALRVVADEVEFRVNGATIHTLPAAGLRTDGQIGLRINHMLDVHVEDFTVEQGV